MPLLNNVDALFVGASAADKAYLGATEVWAAGGGGGGLTGVTGWAAPGASYNAGTNRVGWRFTVGASDLTVSALRHFGNGADAATFDVRIHRDSDNVLMANADVARANNAWGQTSITPVVLAAGVTYTVSARSVAGTATVYRNPTSPTYSIDITVTNTGVFGSGDTRPNTNSSANYAPAADFVYAL